MKKIEVKEIDKNIGQEQLNILCNGIALQGEKVTSQIKDKVFIKSVKQTFRSLLKKIIYDKSILMKRTLEKPRGYPGDYETIEMNYNNVALSQGIGAYFDNYFLSNNYAIAVRNRKDKMLGLLTDFMNSPFKKKHIHILNLGSGSLREIRELLVNHLPSAPNLTFTCIDHDEESFNFAKKHIPNLPDNITINYVKQNLLNLLNDTYYVKKYYRSIDMVYSIGLADYFLDTILEKLVSFSFNILPSQGTLILAHKDIDADPLTPIYFDWFCDWKFVPRNEEKLVKIIRNSGIKNYSLNIEREASGIIFFAKLVKNK